MVMKKIVSVVDTNGVEQAASLTAKQADYYLRLAQLRASSSGKLMDELCDLLSSKSKLDAQQNKDQRN
jgi:DNA-directed RNA polymerase subunit F